MSNNRSTKLWPGCASYMQCSTAAVSVFDERRMEAGSGGDADEDDEGCTYSSDYPLLQRRRRLPLLLLLLRTATAPNPNPEH